jgi:DNA-directed RNA polymerase
MTKEELKVIYGDLYERQLELEKKYKNCASDRQEKMFRVNKEEGDAASLSLGQRLINRQFSVVRGNIEKLVDSLVAPKAGAKANYTDIVKELVELYADERDKLLDILTFIPFSNLLNSAMQVYVTYNASTLSALANIVGKEIQEEAMADSFLNSLDNPTCGKVLDGLKKRKDRHYKTYFLDNTMRNEGHKKCCWDTVARAALGVKLLELTVAGSGYFELSHGTSIKGDSILEIRPTQWLLEAWNTNEAKSILKAFKTCPTVIPPAPWTSVFEGAYYGDLRGRQPLLRTEALIYTKSEGSNIYNKEYLEKLSQLDLGQVRGAVNQCQETPWVINREVLAVVKAIQNRGGGLAGIPLFHETPRPPELTGDFEPEELIKHKKDLVEYHKHEHERKSKVLRALSHIGLAEEFADFDQIYFPHNLDFRGRVYPVPAFNPQGDDLNKGLLLFANVPECQTMQDIEWMMVHGANLAGVDKVSFPARKQWIRDNEEHILRSAEDPLGYLWWTTLDDCPIQFLGFCFEWAKWKKHEKTYRTPKGFKTGIVVAFDGTCSGLQHFSAILRDSVGGQAVNLLPQDTPNDIYRAVAEKVQVIVEQDAKKGSIDEESENEEGETFLKLGTKSLAQQWLLYGITRKVTKRCVMTFAYGSKEYGFKQQLLEDIILKARKEKKGEMFIKPVQAAAYLAKLIWNVIQEVVVKAVEGMAWLQKMARLVCKEGNVVTWVTPMGLPIQQAYMEPAYETFRLRFGGGFRRLYTTKPSGNIDKHAQVNGIAPNFIHSLDASHLQMTILEAYDRGIKHFAMIHDSYGSPVAQAQEMFSTVRYTFHKMYTEHDVLETFAQDMEVFIDQSKVTLPTIPKKGKLDLKVVLESPYMFA